MAAQEKSRVVIARGGAVPQILDKALAAFYRTNSALDAWKRLVRPGEVVGLKVNCLAGRGISTSVPLVDAICERLRQAGVKASNIIIWDRLDADLESAGFRTRNGIRCLGNDQAGYESDLQIFGSAGSLLSRTLTRACDAVINVPVLKDHGIVGVTMALKNLFGAIHNPNKYHMNAGDPYVADVYMLPPIRQKVRLAICDGIKAQYEGGPSFMPQWIWAFNGLLVARDPVALDTVGWDIIERKRAEKGVPALKAARREPRYIATAARHGIGSNTNIERLEV